MTSNKLYDALKFIAQIFLPAVGTLYVALGALYGLGNVDVVVGTIVAVDTFLGVFVAYLALKYNKSDDKFDGEINVVEDAAGNTLMDMQLNKVADPTKLGDQDEVLFKVNKPV